ncbi:unnamed protein product [Cylicocyclus nassatus]|uniref:SXP/RAL-2 family protein Ani s 5-like cation-binding domain-containing protein n=1 Tax=Cylicocyclus nassatus TaxID=53992 RepID=A0AA36GU61_CYLNA|nr:unnamed protein product [Cylicocyclus nassatus]
MQPIIILVVIATLMCTVAGKPGDVFPQKAVWESIDLQEVLKGLPEEAKQEWKKIDRNTDGTLEKRREAKKEWAKKYGVENQWNDFVKKRANMVSKTAELLAKLPELYQKYRDTWKGDELWKNIEKKQKKLAAKYKKEFMLMNIAKEMVERAEHKIKY